jgi:hypothetical protein
VGHPDYVLRPDPAEVRYRFERGGGWARRDLPTPFEVSQAGQSVSAWLVVRGYRTALRDLQHRETFLRHDLPNVAAAVLRHALALTNPDDEQVQAEATGRANAFSAEQLHIIEPGRTRELTHADVLAWLALQTLAGAAPGHPPGGWPPVF